eukprot:2866666-Alexandrium_andersonii.AAC.1
MPRAQASPLQARVANVAAQRPRRPAKNNLGLARSSLPAWRARRPRRTAAWPTLRNSRAARIRIRIRDSGF